MEKLSLIHLIKVLAPKHEPNVELVVILVVNDHEVCLVCVEFHLLLVSPMFNLI